MISSDLEKKKDDFQNILNSVKEKVSSLLYNLGVHNLSNTQEIIICKEMDIITSFLKEIDRQIDKVSEGKI